MADILCPTCGRPNSKDREFCDFCGNPLDGALTAKPQGTSLRNDLFTEESSPDLPQDRNDQDEISRLESLLSETEGEGTPFQKPTPESGEESSRLDEYLPAEEPLSKADSSQRKAAPEETDDTSRLEEYFREENPVPPPPGKSQPQEPTKESSRLEEYIKEESSVPPVPENSRPQEPIKDSPPLEDPFVRDPFKSPDPFQETPLSGEEESDRPEEEFDPFKIPPEELDLTGELDSKKNKPPSQAEAEDPWEFFSQDSPGEPTGGESPPASEDSAGEKDFPDSAPPEKSASSEIPDEAPIAETSAGEWGFLDPKDAGEEPVSPTSEDSGEKWDFLDPGISSAEPAEQVPDDQTPDEFAWLDPGPAADLPEDEDQPEFGSQGFGEDSGWLDMLQGPESSQAPPPESSQPKKPQTDWLEKIKRLNKSSDLVDEDSSFPDWLAVSNLPTAEPEEPEQMEPGKPSSEVPEWLNLDDDESLNEFLRRKDLTNEEHTPQISEVSQKEAEDDEPATGLSDSQQIKFPSWAEEQKKKSQSPEDLQFLAAYEDDASKSAEPFQIEEEFFDDLFDEELPDWLTAASSKEVSQPLQDELAQGELPGWVEAMRPVVESTDASGLAEDEEYIESYGPLAGIPSVLPAEAEIGINLNETAQKPLDLLTSTTHQENVNLLKKIISNENKSRSIQRPAPLQTQRVLRWLIAIVLLFSTAVTVIFNNVIETQPPSAAQIRGTSYAALYDQIEKLQDGQPVLIAYDYQPAASGELHIAAASVVDHLMEKGTYLSFVSTQPTGPVLAEQFLASTQAEHGYLHTQKYINLGYLPGESAGLLSFTISPKQIIPLAFDGSNAWDSPPLINVNSISDFSMILVITDDPNIAKIWIEQVGTQLEDTPLTMVVSAQVEPLIQPYFKSSPQPLAGYVAGIIGSMNYEQLTESPNLASKIWLPFNVGIVISVGIIFIGGLANGVLSIFSQRRTRLLGDTR